MKGHWLNGHFAWLDDTDCLFTSQDERLLAKEAAGTLVGGLVLGVILSTLCSLTVSYRLPANSDSRLSSHTRPFFVSGYSFLGGLSKTEDISNLPVLLSTPRRYTALKDSYTVEFRSSVERIHRNPVELLALQPQHKALSVCGVLHINQISEEELGDLLAVSSADRVFQDLLPIVQLALNAERSHSSDLSEFQRRVQRRFNGEFERRYAIRSGHFTGDTLNIELVDTGQLPPDTTPRIVKTAGEAGLELLTPERSQLLSMQRVVHSIPYTVVLGIFITAVVALRKKTVPAFWLLCRAGIHKHSVA